MTFSVAVALNDTATIVATKIITALNLNASLTGLYTVSQDGAKIVLTKKIPSTNDTTLNVSIANGNCAGLTNATTSADTKAGVAYAVLTPITNYPDLGATPSKLDTTDLTSAKFKTSILGLQEIPDLTFEANYDKTVYTATALLTDVYGFRLEFGTSGADGIYTWDGHVSIFAMGAGVDEVRKMQLTLSAETEILAS